MILISRIESVDFHPKITPNLISKNLLNSCISNIVIFTNFDYKHANSKVKVIVKSELPSETECISEAKSIFNKEIFIWSEIDKVFSPLISKWTSTDNFETIYQSTNNEIDFLIFNSSNFSNRSSKIIDCLSGKKINIGDKKIFNQYKKTTNIQLIEKKQEVTKTKGQIFQPPPQIVNVKKIDTIIVSVDYNDLLVLCLKYNRKYLENITVVTSNSDLKCKQICEKFGVNCVITDKMYEDGALFNKGKAINEGIKSIKDPDWILILDADIILTKKIEYEKLEKNTLYTSDRWICTEYKNFKDWIDNKINIESISNYDTDRAYGFFQLFNYNNDTYNGEPLYSEKFDDAALSDTKFSERFKLKETLNTCIHLGRIAKNWKGRKTESFISDQQIDDILNEKSTYKICSYYFNFRNDERQKENFKRFIKQFEGYYHNMIVGLVDYGDGDLDFDIPCEKFIIKGDKENKLWSKEIIINQIIDNIETDYLIWIDGDIIYENLDWLNDIDSVADRNDFVQLFETINYLDENGNIIETRKGIISSGRNDIDNLLGEGYMPGGAWMGRTSILKKHKLFDQMYVGGGDTIFVYGLFGIKDGWTLDRVKQNNYRIYTNLKSWIESFGSYKVSFLKNKVSHLYHGDLKNRNYNERYLKLKDNSCKIVVFTENIGSYDILQRAESYKNVEFVAFFDRDVVVEGWKCINIDDIEEIKSLKNTKLICKFIRTHSQELLPNHDFSLHIDANMILKTDPNEIVEEMKKTDSEIMCFKHYKRTSVYEEAKQCIEWKLDNPKKIKSQIEKYSKEGLTEGLYECGFFLRRNNSTVSEFDKLWWEEIKNFSIRDQISFPYILNKSKAKFNTFNVKNRFESKYIKIETNEKGETHIGNRQFTNNIVFIYDDKKINWGSTKMRGFDIAKKLGCKIIPISQSSDIKYKKIICLKLSNYEDILSLSKFNEIVIDMVDFDEKIHDLKIFNQFDYGIFTSDTQRQYLDRIFKYPEKCKTIYHHWDERLNQVKVKKMQNVKIAYFGLPQKCYLFNQISEIKYNIVDWFDFEQKLSEYENYNVHFAVRPPSEQYKIGPLTKIAIAAKLGCIIIISDRKENRELLGEKYPYYCEEKIDSIMMTIEKIKETFLTKTWFDSIDLLKNICEETSLDTISQKYLEI